MGTKRLYMADLSAYIQAFGALNNMSVEDGNPEHEYC